MAELLQVVVRVARQLVRHLLATRRASCEVDIIRWSCLIAAHRPSASADVSAHTMMIRTEDTMSVNSC
eukprot:COSAG01_NODE_2608_length_7388_cov_2.860200_5_plen_68_part_00